MQKQEPVLLNCTNNMALIDLEISATEEPLPQDIESLLADAQARIDRLIELQRDKPIFAYVPSDFVEVYRGLKQIQLLNLMTGQRFVEWGSGVGVTACLASMLNFDSIGIEIEPSLVEASQELAADHELTVEFVEGSFVPSGAEWLVGPQNDLTWLRDDGIAAYDTLGLDPDDFDLVFAYPWPGEEQMVFELFNHCGATGSLLLTFHGENGLRLQRKVLR